MKIKKISPLKDKPLRNPGESLDCRLIDLFLDKIIFYMVLHSRLHFGWEIFGGFGTNKRFQIRS